MTKQEFSKVLLSRFISLDGEGQCHFALCLVQSNEELCQIEKGIVIEETKEFTGWVETIAEALFPEIIGDIVIVDK